MTVDPSHSAGSHTHRGTTYYFCNSKCLEKFKANPAQYLDEMPSANLQARGASLDG
jgi:P-type Cu+ transporter